MPVHVVPAVGPTDADRPHRRLHAAGALRGTTAARPNTAATCAKPGVRAYPPRLAVDVRWPPAARAGRYRGPRPAMRIRLSPLARHSSAGRGLPTLPARRSPRRCGGGPSTPPRTPLAPALASPAATVPIAGLQVAPALYPKIILMDIRVRSNIPYITPQSGMHLQLRATAPFHPRCGLAPHSKGTQNARDSSGTGGRRRAALVEPSAAVRDADNALRTFRCRLFGWVA